MTQSASAAAIGIGMGTTIVVCEDAAPSSAPTLTLKLKRPRVRWAEGTVDNEDLNRKKSKCCCIFHKPHNPDDLSGDESEADDDALPPAAPCPLHDGAGDAAPPQGQQGAAPSAGAT